MDEAGKELKKWFLYYRRRLRQPPRRITVYPYLAGERHVTLDGQACIAHIELNEPYKNQTLVGYDPRLLPVNDIETIAAHEAAHEAFMRMDDYAEKRLLKRDFHEWHDLFEESIQQVAEALVDIRRSS